MQRYTIAIDLDDTLYDFVGLLLEEYNKKYGDCGMKKFHVGLILSMP